MIDISKTVLALSVAPDNVTQEELRDIDECLRVLYTTPMGSQEGDRRLGINVEAVLERIVSDIPAPQGDAAAAEEMWQQVLEILKSEKKRSMVACAAGGHAIDYVNGNGEIVHIRESEIIKGIDVDRLADTLLKDGWGRAEVDVITRLITICGLRWE